MALFKRGLPRLLFIIIVVICVLVVFLNVFLNIELGKRVPGYLERFSERTGYELQVDDVNLDPLFRLRLSGIAVSEPSVAGSPLAEIKSVVLEPRIFSSLIEGRVSLGRVVVERPVVRYSKDDAEKVLALFKGGGGGEGGSPAVGIERIRLEDSRLEISPDLTVRSERAEIAVAGSGRGVAREVRINGEVTALDREMDFSGKVNLSPGETTGSLKIVVDKTNGDLFPEWLGAPRDINAVSESTFQISDGIKVEGGITVKADSEQDASGFAGITYSLRYDSAGDTAYLDSLDFELMDALRGSFSGAVKDVTGEMNFDITGRAAAESLKEIVKWLPDMSGNAVSGAIKVDNLNIGGSRKNNDIALKGEVVLNDVNFADKGDGFKVEALDCRLGIKEDLSAVRALSFSSGGTCSMEALFWEEAGEVSHVSGKVGIKPAGDKGYAVLFSGIDGRYMEGRIGGSFEIIPGDGGALIRGELRGGNLDLEKAPERIVPLSVKGNARAVSAGFTGKAGDYNADISFAISDLMIRSKAGREFRVSKAETGEPVRFEYISAEGGENKDDSGSAARGKVLVEVKGLSYEGLSFDEYFIQGGTVDRLDFSLNQGGLWALRMSSEGRGFEVPGKEVSLERFSEHLEIENSGREGFSGTIEGESGGVKGVEFPALSAEYEFRGDSIDIKKLSAVVGTIGEFTADRFVLQFGKRDGGYPYKVLFEEGKFEGLDGGLKSRGIVGSLILNGPGRDGREWEGNVKADSVDIFSRSLTGISFVAVPSADGVQLTDLTAGFLGGDLSGRVDINTSGSDRGVVTDLSLRNASFDSGGIGVNLSKSGFQFSGTIREGSLPEGTGKLEFDSLRISKEGAESVFGGSVNLRTSGETLFIGDGFIRNGEKGEMRFSGVMADTLKEHRTLELDFPELSVPDAVRFFNPFLPQAMRDSRTGGTLSLHVEFHGLFGEESSWKGGIDLKNASFESYIGGADLYVRDINGGVRIKDKGMYENTLASLMGNELELNKRVYRKYQRSFKEAQRDGDLDLLKIGEIEYGILLFRDVECELEVDREKINLSRLVSEFFSGKLYTTGLLRFDGGNVNYNFSFLFNDVSLEGISKRLSSIKDYITGRVNGLIWLTGEGGELGTIDGPFEFWSVKSSKEARVIGKALLDQLGAKERFFLGSTRSYDKGEISGYINDGVITFKKLDISNTVLGFKNLSIQTDPVRNSISIAHLVSVIREISRRSQTGGPTIETN